MKNKRYTKEIKISYKFIPDEYSEEKLTGVYSILFDEIQTLIEQEKLNLSITTS